ncbi:ATP-binding cassette domain-containing protein [Actinobacillus equuli subsp. haemolyticus]|uniref:Iron(III) ABC transporter ATP-binding protein n=1 Tax=Actinobacillus equuli TaxID=718 RepID=A0AAX3FQA9_ACTEU|nr:ATP-binding cassette domain-containing protein [Actinobacillus equuli]AIZ78846.1 iron ABC transporter ATP-binding protein [Actinobacillus equuli subsp. equuli]WGE42988.1 ATP-binding cassette domain-containing protein [Actinobacillus equuli subsp. haemolyticus]WGE45106.1 ATP-binding cassette domain-containing protein [Actinobacillus equuli subsp. equuli]WGE53705.1 ATP-binding cassette domain-containing protein [Actinobacillus equuli subsp. haemolyticus]WGE59887.1 ATP-binding cassette domain-
MIDIKNISHKIGNTTILNNINLHIPNGGITALIGANGAGKSTLLSLIARLQNIQSGQIWLNNYNIAEADSRKIAQHLAILTQDNVIHSRITVQDLLMFGRYPHHQGKISEHDRQVVEKALQRFELDQLKDRFLNELSGGQRQRALIAMTFCQQTQHVLLDEPLNNLDMFHARELMRLLRKLTDELQLTTVMVVHDINMAAAYADTIVAMKNGEIIMTGSPEEIITPENLKTVFNLDAEVLEHNGKRLVVHHI